MEKRKLVTIVTEVSIEQLVIHDIKKLGAHGYTSVSASGEGSRGMRQGDWDLNKNVRIEIICDETTARAIADHLMNTYYEHYAMVVYIADVEVLRPGKF
jgi:nitrogen regulatory protein PII